MELRRRSDLDRQESDPQLYDCGVQDRDFGGRQWPRIKQRQSNRYGRRAFCGHCRPFEHKVGPHPRNLDRPGQTEAAYRLRPYLARKPDLNRDGRSRCLERSDILVQLWRGGGALDLRDYYGNFGGLGVASDLGNPSRTAWESATRTYLAQNPTINVIIWSWCGQVDGTQAEIEHYLDLMNELEGDFPDVKFVYMTGHPDGAALTGNLPTRNKQIRDYCHANNKILYDFADIESYDPDGTYFGDKLANDACDYDSNGDGVRDRNWAIDWQNAHPGEWYNCDVGPLPAAERQPQGLRRLAPLGPPGRLGRELTRLDFGFRRVP